MIEIKEIKFPDLNTEASQDLSQRFKKLALEVLQAYERRGAPQAGAASLPELINAVEEFLSAFHKLDNEYGDTGAILLEDTAELADYCIRCLAELRNWLDRLELSALTPEFDKLIIGVTLWAMRHECEITTPEPAVNALAYMANDAKTRQDLAAIYGLMQGLIQAVPASLKSDLEKSNPNRPWRILLINFAIIAIRAQDIPMMRHAFETLGTHLPEECHGFFSEAVEKAEHPGFSDEVRGFLLAEQPKWTLRH